MTKITQDSKPQNTEETENTGDTDNIDGPAKVQKSPKSRKIKKNRRRIRGQGSDKRHGIDRAGKYIEVKNARRARNSNNS